MVLNREKKRKAEATSGSSFRQVGGYAKCKLSATELQVAVCRALWQRFFSLAGGLFGCLRLLLALVPLFFVSSSCGKPRVSGNEAWLRAQGGRARASHSADSSKSETNDLSRYENQKPIDVITGRATYYSDSLAGNRTANGERYNPRDFTAASRELPFGTIVRVVRGDNEHSVIVRINDRGPFRNRDRILDLSRAAAKKLDMIRDGVVDIRAEILEYGRKR
jgi:rare lipoprotein A